MANWFSMQRFLFFCWVSGVLGIIGKDFMGLIGFVGSGGKMKGGEWWR